VTCLSANPLAAHRDGKDLNRAFPERHANGGNLTATGNEPAEVTSIMRLGTLLPFAAGANLHEGAVVVSYPWDGMKGKEQRYAGSPDDAAYVRLAKSFAANHPWMREQTGPPATGYKGIRVCVRSGSEQHSNSIQFSFQCCLHLYVVHSVIYL
jgi:hypothetical protein